MFRVIVLSDRKGLTVFQKVRNSRSQTPERSDLECRSEIADRKHRIRHENKECQNIYFKPKLLVMFSKSHSKSSSFYCKIKFFITLVALYRYKVILYDRYDYFDTYIITLITLQNIVCESTNRTNRNKINSQKKHAICELYLITRYLRYKTLKVQNI